jgi:hypothetical protein
MMRRLYYFVTVVLRVDPKWVRRTNTCCMEAKARYRAATRLTQRVLGPPRRLLCYGVSP